MSGATNHTFSHWPAVPHDLGPLEARESPCPYLPGRVSLMRGTWVQQMAPAQYEALMDAGFRRSGRIVYQPFCAGCRACVALRVPTDRFTPGKAQRRCWRKNADLRVEVGPPVPSREKHALYTRYQQEWHGDGGDGGGGQSADVASFVDFLYTSPVATREFVYRDPAGRLLAVGICDVGPRSLSSVYFYFDPAEARRGLGTYGALWEIAWARAQGLPWWYAGFWVAGCGKMDYKASFRPHELLGTDGVWRGGGEGAER